MEQLLSALKQKVIEKANIPDDDPNKEQLEADIEMYCYQALIQVVEYCNLDYWEVSLPLLLQMYFIVNNQLLTDTMMNDGGGSGDVKSVREGDVTVQRMTLAEKLNSYLKSDGASLIKNYYNVLHSYRKVRR